MRFRRFALVGLAVLGLGGGTLAGAAPSLAALGYLPSPSGSFGETGSGDGQFAGRPGGVAIDEAEADVYVVDRGNNRVEKFDATGNYLGQFAGGETPAKAFANPTDIAVDNASDAAKGDVYVTDVGRDVVDVFTSAGKYVSQLTGAGTESFGELEGVATGASGEIWVYDSFGRVYEFSDTGTLVAKFETGRGVSRGLAVDSAGGIYVMYGCCVAKWKLTSSSSAEQLAEWQPQGASLAIDPANGEPFVDEYTRIQRYGPFGEPYGVPAATFANEGLGESRGLAVNGTDGTVYVTREVNGDAGVAIFKEVLLADAITGPASNLGTTTATISGTIDREGLPTTYRFQYGETSAYGTSTAVVEVVGEEEELNTSLGGLAPATTYHYRIVAENANGATYGEDKTFTTQAAQPTVEDQQPVLGTATRTTAEVTGTVGTGGTATTLIVEYVTASEYRPEATNPYARGASTPSIVLEGSREDRVAGPIGIVALAPGTTYHYRLVARNSVGTAFGQDHTFTTASGTPPVVTTDSAGEVTQTSALLTGVVEAQGLQTSYEFEIGTDTTYSGGKLFGNAGQSAGAENVSTVLQFLVPGVTYHYRLVATNEDGTTYGQDVTFTTPGVPAPIVQPATAPLIASPAVVFPTIPAEGKSAGPKKKGKPGVKHKKKASRKRGKAKRMAAAQRRTGKGGKRG